MVEPPKYLNYITSAFKDKPKFVETVAITTNAVTDVMSVMLSLIPEFKLEQAKGKQLDTIGEWVGRDRSLQEPIEGVFFAWNISPDVGWNAGVWWDKYTPQENTVLLDDSSYRYILQMYIATNHWDGNANSAERIWGESFGYDNFIIITDYQDMTIDIGFSGTMPAPAKLLVKSGKQPFKPESVRVKTYFTNNYGGPIFGFDIATKAINGYDVGYWSDVIEMN